MAVLVYLLLFLALTGYSNAAYCVCKDGLSDAVLQKALDYACGAGADCTPILQNGACYNPNTIKDHCSYAANSYYQRKSQSGASCDFQGTATLSSSPPTGTPSTCVYPSSASNAGTTPTGTPSTSTTPPGTSTTPPGTSTTPPGTNTTPTGTTTPTGGTTTTPTGGITTPTPSVFGTGLGPTGSGLDNPSGAASFKGYTNLLMLALCWFSGLILLQS